MTDDLEPELFPGDAPDALDALISAAMADKAAELDMARRAGKRDVGERRAGGPSTTRPSTAALSISDSDTRNRSRFTVPLAAAAAFLLLAGLGVFALSSFGRGDDQVVLTDLVAGAGAGVDGEPTATPEPTLTPVPVEAIVPAPLYAGTPRCVSGVPIDDPLNVRQGPGAVEAIIAVVGEGSCALRVMGESFGGLVPVRLIDVTRAGQADAPRTPQVIEGWVFASYLVDPAQVDSPQAGMLRDAPSRLIWHAPATPQCTLVSPDRAECTVASWEWQVAGSPCADLPGEPAKWKDSGGGTVFLDRTAGAWIVTEARVLVVDC